MNKSVDERLLPQGEYIDALNVRAGSTEDSEIGAIENSKGNELLTNIPGGITTLEYNGTALDESNGAMCIGAYEDGANETIYFFVTSNIVDIIASWTVAEDGVSGAIRYHVISTSVLNFNKQNRIVGINKVDDLLFFTDNYNQPRKINVTRSYAEPENDVDLITEDDLSVIVKPPFNSPVISSFTSEKRGNYLEDKVITFSYRWRYQDGEYSALSPFSEAAFEPSPFFINVDGAFNGGMKNRINNAVVEVETGSDRVEEIQICFKRSGNNNVYVIDNYNKENLSIDSNSTFNINFDNSKIYTVLPQDELFRLYDNVPRFAKAQTIMGNRIMYGNYVDGYDMDVVEGQQSVEVDIDANLVSFETFTEPVLTSQSDSSRYDIDPANQNYTVTDARSAIDFSSFLSSDKLKKGSIINFLINISHDSYTTTGTAPTDFQKSFNISSSFVLGKNYTSANDLVSSPEFASFIGTTNNIKPIASSDDGGTLTDIFNSNVSTSSIPAGYSKAGSGLTAIGQGFDYNSAGPNIILITCNAMKYTHATDPDIYEYFSFNVFAVTVTSPDGFQTLHSNRNYELGIVYLDEYGRQSTVFTSTGNSVYTPAYSSSKKNQIEFKINSEPPYWATAYRPVIKPSYSTYETIYCFNNIFENSGFAYFLLEGENSKKVNEGDKLIVKVDSGGPTQNLVETTVLEVEAKERNFLIPGGAVSDIQQPAGVYMKLRPTNFSVDSNIYTDSEDLVFNAISSFYNGLIVDDRNSSISDRGMETALLSEDDGTGTHVPVPIPQGSVVSLLIQTGWAPSEGCHAINADTSGPTVQYVAERDYTDFREMVIAQQIDFAEGMIYYNQSSILECYPVTQDNTLYTGTTPPVEAAGSNPPEGENRIDFYQNTSTGELFLRSITGATVSEVWRALNGRVAPEYLKDYPFTFIEFQLQRSAASENGVGGFVFETKPVSIDNDIYFESSETFLIENGLHKGNQQNQLQNTPAVSLLDFHDCYTFGNGVESYKVEDLIGGDSVVIGQRTTAVSEQDYKKAHRFASITYSGVYNAETNLNKLNQFNLSLANFSDLEKSFGNIGILHARETDLLVLQEDRVSYVLQGKNLLSDSVGGGAITSVPEVLGTQIARNEEYGISSDAETFVHFGNEVYFTDSKRGAVLNLVGGSFKQDKLVPISELGMRSFFRDTFIESFRSYKLGGFDPYMNEYVLTINEDEQDVVTEIIEEVECSSDNEFTTELINQDTYEVQFDPFIGTVEIDYTVQSINETIMQVVWDDTQVVNSVISGTGSVSFSKTKNYPDTATVTISCPGLDVQPCNAGMDVLFLVDYSSLSGQTWMPEHLQTLKNDMSSIITTIEQQSGGDYRLGLVTYESIEDSLIPSFNGETTAVGGADRLIDSNANFVGVFQTARGLNPFDGSNVSFKISSTELQVADDGYFNVVGMPYAVGPEITGDWPKYTVQGDYHYLPSAQKYIDTDSSYIPYITCFEKLSAGNKDSFNRYLRSIGRNSNATSHLQGSTTSTATNKLIDGNATFVTDGIRPGDVIYKYQSDPSTWSSGISATVVSVDSETQLTLDANIFSPVVGDLWTYGTQQGTDAVRGNTPLIYKSQPSGVALSRIVEHNLAGAFRNNVNKQIILYTNTKPGGENAVHNQVNADEFRRLASICNDLGIVLNIVGPDENPNVPDTWNVYSDAVSITNGVRINSFASGSVLSAIESTCGAERTIPSYRCDQDITSLSLSSISTYTYKLDLGNTTGSAFVNFSSANPMSISVEYNGTTYTGGPNVSGQVEIPVTTQSLATTSIATVTLASDTNQTGVSITHTCPVLPPERKVYLVVLNDANQAGETITNSYKVNSNTPYSVDTVFDADGVSEESSVSGFTDGSNVNIPLNGDTVTITSTKIPGESTGDFNPCNSIGLYVGPEQDLSPDFLLNNAKFGTITSTTAADGTETNETTLPVESQDEGENPDAIYLIWNYRDNLPNLGEAIRFPNILQGGNANIPLLNEASNIIYPVTVSITVAPSHGIVTRTDDSTIPPEGFVAANKEEAIVKYTHDDSTNLIDNFTFSISSGGTCSATNTVETRAIEITPNTYIYFYFDNSGSMGTTNSLLRNMALNEMKNAFLPFYEDDEELYFNRVFVHNLPLITDPSSPYYSSQQKSIDYTNNHPVTGGVWRNERTWLAALDIKQNGFSERVIGNVLKNGTFSLTDGPNFALTEVSEDSFVVEQEEEIFNELTPLYGSEATGAPETDRPDKVVVIIFGDESESPNGELYRYANAYWDPNRTPTNAHKTDVRLLKSRINSLNATNPDFYSLIVFGGLNKFTITNRNLYIGTPQVWSNVNITLKYNEYLRALKEGSNYEIPAWIRTDYGPSKYVGEDGLSTYIVGGEGASNNPSITINTDLVLAEGSDTRPESDDIPFIPEPYRSNTSLNPGQRTRFLTWKDYYLFNITLELLNLGFENPDNKWPIVDSSI